MTAATVRLGDGLMVSPLGFGGMALTPVYGEVDPAEALRTLHHAVDAGVSFIDTADIYGGGSNEELIARLLKERRGEVQLATKFGLVGTPSAGYTDIRGDAAYVRQAVDRSLQRLGTDTIDLYYLHRRDLRVPIVETVEAMAGLVQAGKVRHLGLSEVTAEELREASTRPPDRRGPERMVHLEPRRGTQRCSRRRRTRGGFCAVFAAGPGIPHRHRGRLDAGQQRLPPQHPALRRGCRRTPTRAWWRPCRRSLPNSALPGRPQLPPRWRWPGCSRRAASWDCPWSPSPAPARRTGSTRTWAPWPSTSPQRNWRTLDAAADAVVGSRSADPNWVSQGRE